MSRYRLGGAHADGFADGVDLIAGTGWLLALAVVVYGIRLHSLAAPVTKSLTTFEWLLFGVLVPLVAAASTLAGPSRRALARVTSLEIVRGVAFLARVSGVALAAVVTVGIGIGGHRLAMLVPAAATALVFATRRGSEGARYERQGPDLRIGFLTVAAAWIGWWGAESVSYTRVDHLLLSATTTDAPFLIAFACAIVLVAGDAARPHLGATSIRERRFVWGTFLLVAACLSLRTDSLQSDWIFYHRSFYTVPAAFVRQGQWLLWDVPSQYGFLSILTVAGVPGATTWDALDLLLAGIGIAQAAALFAVLRYGRCGPRSALVAGTIALAVIFTADAGRYPSGEENYPQFGLRTFFLVAGVAVVLRRYLVAGDVRKRRRLMLAGDLLWTVAVFWSFEVAAWQTAFWLPLVALVSIVDSHGEPFSSRLGRLALALGRPLLFAGAFAGVITSYYELRLRHAPDWLAYVEYSLAYSGSTVASPDIWRFGPLWFLLTTLALFGTVLLWAVRSGRWQAVPVAAATWLAVWASTSYYAGEAFAIHVNALVPLFVFCGAVCSVVLQREGAGRSWQLSLRALSLPIVALVLACAAPLDQWRTLRVPAPWHVFDAFELQTPVLEPELETLLERGHVPPDAAIVLPNRPNWVKTSAGMIMPFRRLPDGAVVAVRDWLPYGPAGANNALMTLPLTRRQTYVDRFLAMSNRAGWLVTYRQPADCAVLSQRLSGRSRASTSNFSLALCSLRPASHVPRGAATSPPLAANDTPPRAPSRL